MLHTAGRPDEQSSVGSSQHSPLTASVRSSRLVHTSWSGGRKPRQTFPPPLGEFHALSLRTSGRPAWRHLQRQSSKAQPACPEAPQASGAAAMRTAPSMLITANTR